MRSDYEDFVIWCHIDSRSRRKRREIISAMTIARAEAAFVGERFMVVHRFASKDEWSFQSVSAIMSSMSNGKMP